MICNVHSPPSVASKAEKMLIIGGQIAAWEAEDGQKQKSQFNMSLTREGGQL